MKTIVITGATSGIGLETARLLARKGYRILGIGRTEENNKKALNSILAENPGAKVAFFTADLMGQRAVLLAANEITEYLNENFGGELYALINNAGCVRSRYMTTDEGYEQQFALNCLSGFLLTHELLPLLKKSGGRVIMTGSKSHKGIRVRWDDVMLRRGYNPLTAYKQSKLCNLLFAVGLNDRYAEHGIRAFVVDPGLVNTEIGNKNTGTLVNFFWRLRKRFGVSPAVPAKTYAFLCEPESEPNGLYYYLCKKTAYSGQVTGENADRFFSLCERLCGVSYDREEKA